MLPDAFQIDKLEEEFITFLVFFNEKKLFGSLINLNTSRCFILAVVVLLDQLPGIWKTKWRFFVVQKTINPWEISEASTHHVASFFLKNFRKTSRSLTEPNKGSKYCLLCLVSSLLLFWKKSAAMIFRFEKSRVVVKVETFHVSPDEEITNILLGHLGYLALSVIHVFCVARSNTKLPMYENNLGLKHHKD